jgi:hypothetical protein
MPGVTLDVIGSGAQALRSTLYRASSVSAFRLPVSPSSWYCALTSEDHRRVRCLLFVDSAS